MCRLVNNRPERRPHHIAVRTRRRCGCAGSGISTFTTATLKEYGAVAGTLGLAFYGLLRLAYAFFYLRLRTTPEEVGDTYARVISESIAGAVELVLLGAIVFAAPASLYQFARLMFTFRSSQCGRRRRMIKSWDAHRRVVRAIVMRSLAISAVLCFASLPLLAWWQGGLAQRGQTVRNLYFVGVPYLPVLAVQAVPAAVNWKDGADDKPFKLSQRACLMYLGQADGVTILYDVQSRDSIRLPTEDITVTLRFAFFVPDSCR